MPERYVIPLLVPGMECYHNKTLKYREALELGNEQKLERYWGDVRENLKNINKTVSRILMGFKEAADGLKESEKMLLETEEKRILVI